MIKLTSMIVDQNYKLIGFTGEGKAKDFGELSNKKIVRPISLKYIFDTKFHNKQITVSNGSIIEHDGFKLNSLGMLMLVGNEYVTIDNSIRLVGRYVQNNENIGFEVEIGKDKPKRSKFTYENVIKLCDTFRPDNFIIRFNTKGQRFIAGKPGCPLKDLPQYVIGEASTAKRTKSTTKQNEAITGSMNYDTDILELYAYIRDVNGYIINLPGTKYKAVTKTTDGCGNFIPFDIGEIGTPYLDFNETKFNVSCNFKKPGAVAVTMPNGKPTNVITFVYRRKNVFNNGDNYINRLGVAIPESVDAEFNTKFGKSMSLTEINDPGMIKPVSMLIGQTNVKFYEVDTSKIGIIARHKMDELILNATDLHNTVLKIAENKFIAKYLKGLIKDIRETSGVLTTSKVKDIAPQFAAMNSNELETLMDNGVDIYTGAYTVRDASSKKTSENDEAVEVKYEISGLSSSVLNKLTYMDMAACTDKVPGFLTNIVAKMNSIAAISKRLQEAENMLEAIDKETYTLKSRLWLHKCSMYLKSNKTSVHSHDNKNWELNTSKRTKAKCYNCRVKGCENLQLLVLNIDIK